MLLMLNEANASQTYEDILKIGWLVFVRDSDIREQMLQKSQ